MNCSCVAICGLWQNCIIQLPWIFLSWLTYWSVHIITFFYIKISLLRWLQCLSLIANETFSTALFSHIGEKILLFFLLFSFFLNFKTTKFLNRGLVKWVFINTIEVQEYNALVVLFLSKCHIKTKIKHFGQYAKNGSGLHPTATRLFWTDSPIV